jgi:cation diffusion facilitator family transporter
MHAHPTTTIGSWEHDHSFGLDKRQAAESRTKAVVAITTIAMVVEIAGGLVFGSMALLADGLHMGSHALALGISAMAYVWMRRHARDRKFSFGTGKMAALGGFAGALLLLVPVAFMVWESIGKLVTPVDIAFGPALGVAITGLAVNAICAVILAGGGDHHDHAQAHDHHDVGHGHDDHHGHADHNFRAAFVHVAADALTSVLAIAALLGGSYFGWVWLDPLMGLVGAVVVSVWAMNLLKGSSQVLLDHEAPTTVQDRLREAIEADSDNRLADLHLWSIGPGIYAAALSLVTHHPKAREHYKALVPANLRVGHVTVEVHRCPDTS